MDYDQLGADAVEPKSPAARLFGWLHQFWLLLWKNYKLQKRSLIGTVLEIAVPALFAFILMPIRRIVKSDQYLNDTTFRNFDVETFDGGLTPTYLFNLQQLQSWSKSDASPFWDFAYQPKNTTLIDNVMKVVADKLLMNLVGTYRHVLLAPNVRPQVRCCSRFRFRRRKVNGRLPDGQ